LEGAELKATERVAGYRYRRLNLPELPRIGMMAGS